ncbi:MAG: hypothetical protein ACE14P_11345 [Methanotrichaceae archaeon]
MKTYIIDSHSEVLPHWFEEYIKLKLPLVVVRIDKHDDMNHECPALPSNEGRQSFEYLTKMMPYLYGYSKSELNEANFTCPAFHYGVIGAVYHFNPSEEKVDAYGRVSGNKFINVPKTKKDFRMIGGKRSNRIFWDDTATKLKIQCGRIIPAPQTITIEEFGEDIRGSYYPVVIGFDLDGLWGIGDKGMAEEIIAEKIEKIKIVLGHIPSPIFACIARSQAPRTYVPPELVDKLQEAALDLIEAAYA